MGHPPGRVRAVRGAPPSLPQIQMAYAIPPTPEEDGEDDDEDDDGTEEDDDDDEDADTECVV